MRWGAERRDGDSRQQDTAGAKGGLPICLGDKEQVRFSGGRDC